MENQEEGWFGKCPCYKLTVFGDSDLLKTYVNNKGKLELSKYWIPNSSFILRRSLFPEFPRCSCLSRKHLEIICEEDNNEQCYSVKDLSSNGTLLRFTLMPPRQPVRLKDGDEIGLLWNTNNQGIVVQFGLRFNTFELTEGENIDGIKSQSDLHYEIDDEDIMEEIESEEEDDVLDGDENDPSYLGYNNNPKHPAKRRIKGSPHSGKKIRINTPSKQTPDEEEDEVTGEKKWSWSAEEQEKLSTISQQRKDGRSWKDIAEDFPKRSSEAVRTKYKKMTEAIDKSATNQASTESHQGLPVRNDEDRRGKLWTPEEDQKLRDLVIQIQPREPADWNRLSQMLGRTVKSCKHKFNDYGLQDLLLY